jgi:class 3 adenylate cyclase/HAMP domain-containing protein
MTNLTNPCDEKFPEAPVFLKQPSALWQLLRRTLFWLISLILLIFIYQQQEWLWPWQGEIPLIYPQQISQSAIGDQYLIDNSERRLLAADQEGRLRFVLQGGRRSKSDFFYAKDVAAYTDGFILLNQQLDQYGVFVEKEVLQHYQVNGRFIANIYERTYSEPKARLVQRGEILAVTIKNDWVYWLLLSENGLEGFRYSLARGLRERLGFLSFPQLPLWISSVAWFDEQHIVLADKNGALRLGSFASESFADPFYQGAPFPEMVIGEIASDGQGVAFVNLLKRQVLYLPLVQQPEPEQNLTFLTTPQVLFSREKLTEVGFEDTASPIYRLKYQTDLDVFTTQTDSSVVVFSQEKVQKVFQTFSLHWPQRFYYAAVLLTFALLFLLNLWLFWRVVRLFFGRNLSIIVKQIFLLLPVLFLATWISAIAVTQQFIARQMAIQNEKIAIFAQTASRYLSTALQENWSRLGNFASEDYLKTRAMLQTLLPDQRQEFNKYYYVALYRVIDHALYGMFYLNDAIAPFYPFSWYEDPESSYRQAQAGQLALERVQDVSGDWLYAVAPIYDEKQNVVALLEAGSDLYSIAEANRAFFWRTVRFMSLITLMVALIVIVMTILILRSIRILRRGVEQISRGCFDYQVDIKTNDEVSELGQHFNQMSRAINNHLREIQSITRAYRRFVPEPFLYYLQLPSITKAELGLQVQKNMTVLFADIRGFTALSEQLTPQQNFDFLNRYLSRIGPVIRQSNGFIDKYIGDAVMALFPERADNALEAALSILQEVNLLNEEWSAEGYSAIAIGIGIHTGPLMLGIIGEAARLQTTVIADSVNLASRLESLTKTLQANILISQETLKNLPDAQFLPIRHIGKVRVAGKKQAIGVCEVLVGLDATVKWQRELQDADLQRAIRYYQQGDFQQSLTLLSVLHEEYDPVVALYRRSCAYYLANPPVDEWLGALILEQK